MRLFKLRRGVLCVAAMVVFLVPSNAFGFPAFDNSPTQLIVSPNDEKAEMKKSAGLRQWEKLQKDFIDKKITREEYSEHRLKLVKSQGGKSDERAIQALQSDWITLGVPVVEQSCKEYCAPASTYSMLAYSGEYGLSQYQIASLQGTGACTPTSSSSEGNAGTCLSPIRNVLNSYYKNPPWQSYFITTRLDVSSETAARQNYSAITDFSISSYHTPFVQLLDARPCGGSLFLPGWGGTSGCGYGHYVTTKGYRGLYDGSAGSRTIYYNDTAWWTAGEKTIDLHSIVHMIFVKTSGSCADPHQHLVY